MLTFMEQIDIDLFFLINHTGQNAFFDIFMPFVSNLSNFYIPLALGWLVLILKKGIKYKVVALSLLVLISLSEGLSTDVLKPIFDRPRPYHGQSNVHLYDRIHKTWQTTPELKAVVRGESRSLPSSHATNIFAAAFFLSVFLRRSWPFFYLIAVSVGYSRVYLGVHYPFDVMAGALAGSLCGLVLMRVSRYVISVLEKRRLNAAETVGERELGEPKAGGPGGGSLPETDGVKISIIIPAYNEEDRIQKTLEKTLGYLDGQAYGSEIIVVSDGSTDGTRGVVEDFRAGENVTLRVIEYHPNRGKGYAVRLGMLEGAGELVMFMDADYSVPIEAVAYGYELIGNGHDIAIASRTVSGAIVSHHQNALREFSAKIYTWIQNCYLGIRYGDTQCGFKIFTREAAQQLFGRQKLNSVIFDPEILWLAAGEGYRVGEFPVEWTHVEGSRIQYDSIRKSLFVFGELFRIKRLHG